MSSLIYQIEFFNYWHASSGLTGSTYADLLVNKTREGLPYIPGRTLKGLLREAAEILHVFQPELIHTPFIIDVFGEQPIKEDKEKELATKEAKAFFTNAMLSQHLSKEIIKNSDQSHLFEVLASTSIDGQKGIAKNGTLRQLEVTVPLTLYAVIEQFPDEPGYQDMMQCCMKWVKRMGLNRTRGLGRCQFSLIIPNQA
jgi:CRISPR/Cas system CSM-associated protein Csm3 (group 7 of RAMP superfamily)